MANIKVEDIVDHLENEFKSALKKTMEVQFPNLNYDVKDFFRVFKQKLFQVCNTWEYVPDNYIEK